VTFRPIHIARDVAKNSNIVVMISLITNSLTRFYMKTSPQLSDMWADIWTDNWVEHNAFDYIKASCAIMCDNTVKWRIRQKLLLNGYPAEFVASRQNKQRLIKKRLTP